MRQGGDLKRAIAGTLVVVAYLVGAQLAFAQLNSSCRYPGGPPNETCVGNSSPDPTPTNLGGSLIDRTTCGNSLLEALASLYSYDEPSCYAGVGKISSRRLIFVEDAREQLNDYEKLRYDQANF